MLLIAAAKCLSMKEACQWLGFMEVGCIQSILDSD